MTKLTLTKSYHSPWNERYIASVDPIDVLDSQKKLIFNKIWNNFGTSSRQIAQDQEKTTGKIPLASLFAWDLGKFIQLWRKKNILTIIDNYWFYH